MSGYYAFPNENLDSEEVTTEDGEVIEKFGCNNCGEIECDYSYCVTSAFQGQSRWLIEGVHFDTTSVDGPVIENDSFLVLAQEELSLEEFNNRVGEIYKEMNPDKEFAGWSFTLTYEEPDEDDTREGVFTATEEHAEAVEKALNEIARSLDKGDYEVEKTDGW